MKLTCLGSESLGNSYILNAGTDILLIEAGIRIQEVKKALNFDLSKVVGCIITHQHGDHCKYLKDYVKEGIDIWAHDSVFDKVQYHGHRAMDFGDQGAAYIGYFTIIPFAVPHGDVHCYGFLISHPTSGKIMFVTDAAHVPYQFKGLSHILIEANYSDEAMVNDHGYGRHMALDTVLSFLRANDLTQVRNVALLHLSASNSDSKQFITEVQAVAPHAVVTVADKGVEIDLSKYPF